jgi:hypothetical protein
MNKQNVRCGWDMGRGGPDDLDGLHDILLCATRRGCNECVTCSERALSLVLTCTRRQIKTDQGENET